MGSLARREVYNKPPPRLPASPLGVPPAQYLSILEDGAPPATSLLLAAAGGTWVPQPPVGFHAAPPAQRWSSALGRFDGGREGGKGGRWHAGTWSGNVLAKRPSIFLGGYPMSCCQQPATKRSVPLLSRAPAKCPLPHVPSRPPQVIQPSLSRALEQGWPVLLAAWPVAGWGTPLLRPRDFPARASADAVLAALRGTAVQPPQPGEQGKKPTNRKSNSQSFSKSDN